MYLCFCVFASQMAGGWINEVTAAEDTAICLVFVVVYVFVFVTQVAVVDK